MFFSVTYEDGIEIIETDHIIRISYRRFSKDPKDQESEVVVYLTSGNSVTWTGETAWKVLENLCKIFQQESHLDHLKGAATGRAPVIEKPLDGFNNAQSSDAPSPVTDSTAPSTTSVSVGPSDIAA